MTPRKNYNNTQSIINNHSNEVLNFLLDLIKSGSLDKKRLFDDHFDTTLPEKLNEFFNDDELINFINIMFSTWDPQLDNKKNINDIKKLVVDHLFKPIEDNKLWQTFLEKSKIVDLNELILLRQHVASEFALKITSSFADKKNWNDDSYVKHKLDMFNLIIAIQDEEKIKTQQMFMINQFMISEIQKILKEIMNNKIESKKIADLLLQQLDYIRKSPHYLAFQSKQEENENNLYNILLMEIENIQTSQVNADKSIIKKITEGILRDLVLHHGKDENFQPLIDKINCDDVLKKDQDGPFKKLIHSLSAENKSTFFNNNLETTEMKSKLLMRSASDNAEKKVKKNLIHSFAGYWKDGAFKPRVDHQSENDSKLLRSVKKGNN